MLSSIRGRVGAGEEIGINRDVGQFVPLPRREAGRSMGDSPTAAVESMSERSPTSHRRIQ